jgi:hypothetical protein
MDEEALEVTTEEKDLGVINDNSTFTQNDKSPKQTDN